MRKREKKNIAQPDRPKVTIWRMRIAWWINKAKDTLFRLTVFFTAEMVAWKRLNITLHPRCMFCLRFLRYTKQIKYVTLVLSISFLLKAPLTLLQKPELHILVSFTLHKLCSPQRSITHLYITNISDWLSETACRHWYWRPSAVHWRNVASCKVYMSSVYSTLYRHCVECTYAQSYNMHYVTLKSSWVRFLMNTNFFVIRFVSWRYTQFLERSWNFTYIL
jgi:hypothetical protein